MQLARTWASVGSGYKGDAAADIESEGGWI